MKYFLMKKIHKKSILNMRGILNFEMNHKMPEHVKVFYHLEDIPQDDFELIISVTYRAYPLEAFHKPHLCFYASVLHLGFGCRRQCCPDGIVGYMYQSMLDRGIHPLALASISSIELKKDEPLWQEFMKQENSLESHIYFLILQRFC